MSISSHKLPPINLVISDFRFQYTFCHYLRLIKALLHLALLLILLTFFYGCILPIPWRSDDPFTDEKKSFSIPGTTTKATVNEKLGHPSASRLGERIYIYAGGQRDYVWLWFVGAGLTSGGGGVPTYMTHLLIIEFDKKDVVTASQEFLGEPGKLESGLYVVRSGGETRSAGIVSDLKGENRYWFFSDPRFILGGSRIMDKQAKQFIVPSNKSAIYYYKNFSEIYEAKLDGRLSVDSGVDGFLLWLVDPGNHTISTVIEVANSEILTLHCSPGQTYYVEHRKGIMREEDKSIAEKEISKRKLVVDRLDTFNFELE